MNVEPKNMHWQRRYIRRTSASGFSLLELLIVTALIAVATAMAIPVLMKFQNSYRLQNATADLASLLQRSRIGCVQNNRIAQVLTIAGGTQVYFDANNSGTWDPGEPIIVLPVNITQTNAGAPAFPVAAGTAMQNPPARFDGRGLPCAFNAGGVCSNWWAAGGPGGGQIGFIYYLRQNVNGIRWTAVSVTPGGQVKSWKLIGGNWVNR